MFVFHAHIYFDDSNMVSAEALRAKAEAELKGQVLSVSRLINRPVGPHPMPMFEIDFYEKNLGDIYVWLRQNHGNHSVLIHKDTQPEIPEHSIYATWIGTPLDLDFSKLDINGTVNQFVMKKD